jgi:hypothetical protein
MTLFQSLKSWFLRRRALRKKQIGLLTVSNAIRKP